mgnify:CR=1 FL=1
MQVEAICRFCVATLRPRGCTPLRVVVAKSALFRFRLTAKTAHAPLLLLSPHDPLRWARAGAPSRLPRAPAEPIHPLTRLYRFGGSESQNRHPDRLPGTPRRTVIFLPIFQPKVGNTFYMARRRQEQTHTQRRDRDMDWRGTSHFLPWMVK